MTPPIDPVCFDCDSTLSMIEGIDALAERAGVLDEMAPLTAAAMAGERALDEIYARRLEVIRPDLEAVLWLGDQYITHLVPDVREVIAALHYHDREIHIISGGIAQAVVVLADSLGIARSRVHAVELYFDAAGEYAGYDTHSPLTRALGKAELCRGIMAEYPRKHGVGSGNGALIGDGITDLEVLEAGFNFIGFGGVVLREPVRARAPCYIDSAGLKPVLAYLLTPQELAQDMDQDMDKSAG